ncbi:MAG: hypothetical protein AAB542_02160 [Patescibacteria group bacterium]
MASRLHAYTIKRAAKIAARVMVLFLCTVGLSLLVVRVFTIKDVVVDAPLMAIELDKSRFGKNLLFLPTEKLRADLLNNYSLLSEVRFEKQYPGTLVVHLIRRNTFAVLRSQGIVYALDERGLVLGGVGDEAGYPVLEFRAGILAIGSEVTHPGVISGLAFLKRLGGSIPISRIFERDSLSIQAVSGHTNIFLPQIGDISGKADTLQTIVEGFRIKGALPTVIDLRHEKPIITN